MKYYTINEEAAANAKAMYSWSEYKHGTKTAEYKSEVDEAYSYAESLPEAAKQRIKELEEAKASAQGEAVETNIEGLKVVENTEVMRIQLIFDDKPSAEVRDVLKSYGFRWAPSYSAWQRHLNSNGKYAAKKVLEILKDKAKEVV